jgi:signal transduction histidine kinase/CheY-like chemotaxis protein
MPGRAWKPRSLIHKLWEISRWSKDFSASGRSGTLAAVSQSAIRGESVEKTLQVAADVLLRQGQGDRVGVWIEGCLGDASWTGATVQKGHADSVAAWRTLNPEAIPRHDATPSAGALNFRRPVFPSEPAGFFDGMESALALPLELAGHCFGVALIASRSARLLARREALESAVSEIAAAVALATTRAQGAAAKRESASSQDTRIAAELRSLLDLAPCGILIADSRGAIRWANETFQKFLGLEDEAVPPGTPLEQVAQLATPRFRHPQTFLAPWQSFTHGSRATQHDELLLSGPDRRILARDAQPILGESGERLGWIEILRDITSQRQFQSKLVQTEKMAALGQLVSGIAHELNNPLTSIMGYAQLLLGRGAAMPGGEAKMIFDEAERARRIVKNLLFFARQTEPERSRVDVNEIIERTVALRGYELKVENIAISTQLDPAVPPTLADPFQLQQVILNLLVNSEQAILESRGHGRITIRTRRISDVRLAIEVCDDGPGIPPEMASRIFDPFFTTKATGTGLGLSIVYGIIEQHGGEVGFENLPAGGAKFTVELPVVAAPMVVRAAPASAEFAFAQSPAARSVLIVEDEPTVAQLVADVLREEGHEVEAVLDSQDGLNRIARRPFDLIICDLRMPRLDGPAFYDALVRSGSPARHHILFITGDTLGPRTIEFLRSHDLPYLAKPFLVEELKLAVNRALQSSGAAPAAVGTARAG